MKRRGHMRWSTVAVVGLVLVSAACGDDDDSSEEEAATTAVAESGAEGAATTEAGAEGSATTEAGAASEGGGTQERLVVAAAVEPETLDLGNLIDTSLEVWQILDPIVQRLPDGSYRPMLAAELPTQPDTSDPLTWQVTLRDDATFHDGTPVDAAAVVEWMTYVASFDPRTKEIVDVAQSFTPTVVDDRTVEISFNTPGAAGVGINSAMSRFLIQKAATPDMDTNPVGTGAYKVAEWNRGQSLTLERNDDYWGDAPPFGTIEFRYIPDAAARVASLQSGEVDVITDLNTEDAEAVPSTITGPTISWFMFLPDGKGKFADVRLRQALYHALDLDAIYEELYGSVGQIPQCQLGDENYTGFNPDLERYAYDPERAEELISEAGAEGLSFTLLAAPNQPRFTELAEVAVEMWRAVGLDPTLDLVPFEQFVPQVTAMDSQPEIFLLARGMETLDYEGYSVIAHPSSGLSSNDDAELTALIDSAAQTADVDEREEILQDVAARTCEEAYGIFVMNPGNIFGVSEGISFEPSPYGARFTRFADAEVS